jgi:acyl carrier protein
MSHEYSDVETTVREILVEQGFIVDAIELDQSTDIRSGLGLDEFKVIELVGALEDAYGITIDTDEIDAAQTVGQFVELVQRST